MYAKTEAYALILFKAIEFPICNVWSGDYIGQFIQLIDFCGYKSSMGIGKLISDGIMGREGC